MLALAPGLLSDFVQKDIEKNPHAEHGDDGNVGLYEFDHDAPSFSDDFNNSHAPSGSACRRCRIRRLLRRRVFPLLAVAPVLLFDFSQNDTDGDPDSDEGEDGDDVDVLQNGHDFHLVSDAVNKIQLPRTSASNEAPGSRPNNTPRMPAAATATPKLRIPARTSSISYFAIAPV
ncbi:MAG: hypothetical protein OD817_04335 [Gammaproteobacteria bacterium]